MEGNPAGTTISLIWQLAESDRDALGAIRLVEGLLVTPAPEQGMLWLGGDFKASRLPVLLRSLPALRTFRVESGLLFPLQGKTPTGRLPALKWTPIRDYVEVVVPVPAPAASTGRQLPFRLVPATEPEAGTALLTDLETWKGFAEGAAAVRLEQLRFAVCEDGRVLVMGRPLPRLPGQEYRTEQALLIPAGWKPEYGFMTSLLSQRLVPDAGSWILVAPDGQWERIMNQDLVKATRSAIRMTRL